MIQRIVDSVPVGVLFEDNGKGIPEAILDNIFDPFFTTKEVGNGAGLGLSVSYGIVSEMGGEIKVANTGTGARAGFEIILPEA
ncbi:sensor histidine kinase [Shewanella glacialimarina]|uniref:sensor histidine kinase n=1 Tax=Shewanella glacialimarina TaxID=2590884 RepID=UPI00299CF9C2|nr:ATP-binding protein [Shewanella glacialimarina]UCX04597.1 hypothetical protein FJ709_08850 [Shewanella glacialimarina]